MLGVVFRAKRVRMNKSIDDVASETGLDKHHLKFIEENKLVPSKDTVIKLCKYYDIDEAVRDCYITEEVCRH